ncbi:UDP-galactopyranose mutase [Flavitalea flava]
MKEYDYLIVGTGLFGAVFAHEMRRNAKRCLVIDKREQAGGNIFCSNREGINVHEYGAHIFNTNDEKIWAYVNGLVKFNNFVNSPLVNYKGKIYNLPFNMNTFYRLWGVTTPEEAKSMIERQASAYKAGIPGNLEEQALSMVGRDIYEIFIKGYSEKQWGRKATELPSFLIRRIPLRFNYDNNYFNSKFQGIPVGGYNKLTERLLEGIEVRLGVDYLSERTFFDNCAGKLVYTGKIDEYFDCSAGRLQYRSLVFKHDHLSVANYQGNAVINYTEREIPYTRIIEHKHFESGSQPSTVITHEYPCEHDHTNEPYYPVNDEVNTAIFRQYKSMAAGLPHVIFGGRLAEFRYYNMDQVIGSALAKADREIIASQI